MAKRQLPELERQASYLTGVLVLVRYDKRNGELRDIESKRLATRQSSEGLSADSQHQLREKVYAIRLEAESRAGKASELVVEEFRTEISRVAGE